MTRATHRFRNGISGKPLRVILVFSLLMLATLGVGLSRRDRHANAVAASLAQGGGPTPASSNALNVALVRVAAPIRANARLPHSPRGPCHNCHQILRVAQRNMIPMAANNLLGGAANLQAPALSTAPAPRPVLPTLQARPIWPQRKRPFSEAHWQGIELIALTGPLAWDLGLAPEDKGVVIDQVSFPADKQGVAAGDLITSLGGVPTPHLADFVAATDTVRDQSQTRIRLIRNGQAMSLVLAAKRLGVANGETPPIIAPDALPPRGCAQAHAALMHLDTLGPCTDCHQVRPRGPLPLDLADLLPKPAVTQLAPPDPLCRVQPGF